MKNMMKYAVAIPCAAVLMTMVACSPTTPSLTGVMAPQVKVRPTPTPTPTPVPPTPTPTPTPVPPTPTPTPTPVPPTPTPTPTPRPPTPTPTPTPVPTPNMKTISSDIFKEKPATPKVDILFVIDNSNSMNEHQQNLRRNIPNFLEAFRRKANVDFHIGMVTVFDPKFVVPGKKFYWESGKLRPIIHPQNNGVMPGDHFVKRGQGYAALLGRTLNIGTHDFNQGGPRYEEIFTPIIAALDNAKNPNFFREEAHLAVIILSDAEESEFNQTTPDQVVQALKNFKGGDEKKISTYGVLAVPDPKNPKAVCRPDEDLRKAGGLPNRILDFIAKSNGADYDVAKNPNVLSICSKTYGEYLAKVGFQIQQKISKTFNIPLEDQAQAKTVIVRINSKEVSKKYWFLDKDGKTIVISDPDEYLSKDGKGNVDITYRPEPTVR